MYTIAESAVFSRYVSDYWAEEERAAFAVWIAEHYDTGDIVRGFGVAAKSGGVVKDRAKVVMCG